MDGGLTSVCLSFCVCVRLPVCPSVHPSVCVSLSLTICLSALQLSDDRDPDTDVGASRGAAQSAGRSALLPAGCGVNAALLLHDRVTLLVWWSHVHLVYPAWICQLWLWTQWRLFIWGRSLLGWCGHQHSHAGWIYTPHTHTHLTSTSLTHLEHQI